jgi:hypothetical protein
MKQGRTSGYVRSILHCTETDIHVSGRQTTLGDSLRSGLCHGSKKEAHMLARHRPPVMRSCRPGEAERQEVRCHGVSALVCSGMAADGRDVTKPRSHRHLAGRGVRRLGGLREKYDGEKQIRMIVVPPPESWNCSK